jgi:hypothetical protein
MNPHLVDPLGQRAVLSLIRHHRASWAGVYIDGGHSVGSQDGCRGVGPHLSRSQLLINGANKMAVARYDGANPAPHRYVGTSGDTKPTTGVPPGSTFIERDTGLEFIYDGTAWGQRFFPVPA